MHLAAVFAQSAFESYRYGFGAKPVVLTCSDLGLGVRSLATEPFHSPLASGKWVSPSEVVFDDGDALVLSPRTAVGALLLAVRWRVWV